MTAEQFLAHLDELVAAVCKRVGQNKVTILGHSWGCALGALHAARFLEKVSACVCSGKIGDWPASEASSNAFVGGQEVCVLGDGVDVVAESQRHHVGLETIESPRAPACPIRRGTAGWSPFRASRPASGGKRRVHRECGD